MNRVLSPVRPSHRGEPVRGPRRTVAILAALALLAGSATLMGVASAFWTGAGSASSTGAVGELGAPTAVNAAQVPGTGTVNVSWTAPAGLAPEGYYVQRTSAGPAVAACGSSAASPITGTSCVDSAVPLGTYTYVVVAVHKSWTATSAPSAPVPVVQTAQMITFTSSPVSPTFGGTYTVTATGGGSGNPVVFSAATPGVCTVTSGGAVEFVHAGACTINADQAGSTYYSAAPQSQQTFQVAKASQTITYTSTAPADAAVDGPGYTPAATGGGSGNAVVFSVATPAVCSIGGGVVTHQHVGTCTINANQAGDADHFAAAQVQQSYEVGQGSQAITFTSTPPADPKVGDTYTATATGGASGNAVIFSSGSPAVCTVGAGGAVSFTGAGLCLVRANQAGNADYLAAGQVTQSIAVTKRDQTITFTSTPVAPTFQGTYTVTAAATSGLAVTFTSGTPGVCTVSGNTVTFVHAGDCTINANQAGNGTYNAAPQVQQSFTVAKKAQTITFTQPASPVNAGTTATLVATATSGLAVTFTSATASVCTVSGTTVTYAAAGTCTINANQPGDTDWAAAAQVQRTVAVQAVGDTTPPSITNVEPGNESGGWAAIDCTTAPGKVCATVTDNVGVASVTMTLTKGNGNCWTGATGGSGNFTLPCTTIPMSLSGGVWVPANTLSRVNNNGAGNFTDTSYTVSITATDAAGNSTTVTRTFTVTGA